MSSSSVKTLFSAKVQFWLLYFTAWLPLFAANTAIMLVDGDLAASVALRRSIAFVVPGALLGIGVLKISRRLPRVADRPFAFGLAQLALSALFSVLYSLGVAAWRRADSWLTGTENQSGIGWLVWFMVSGLMIYGSLAGVGYALDTARRLRHEKLRSARAEALRTEAELAALRAQLNPHFLFNTLHSLLALVRHDPDHAEQALEQFGDLLRYTLRIQQETVDEVPLSEEWAFVENYLKLERLRLGDRLRLETQLDPRAMPWRIPVFSLQPLVENAIGHAVAPRAGGGSVRITARVDGDELYLEVSDDGPGAEPRSSATPTLGQDSGQSNGHGMGLRIVRERLKALTAGRGHFNVATAKDQGFTVSLHIPSNLTAATGDPP